MARSVLEVKKWLDENDAWGLVKHPAVVRNYLRYQDDLAKKATVMRAHPPGVEIELTNRCNIACTQCLRSLGTKPYKLGEMDLDQFKTLLSRFPYVMHLSLNGFGEPLLSPILWDAIAHVNEVRPWCKVLIYTNGMVLSEEHIQKAMQSGLTELNVSLDGGTPEVYKNVRRGSDLHVVSDNVRAFFKARKASGKRFPRLGLNFVMLNDNEGELVPFIELGAELGVDYINCITYATYDWGFQNRRTRESYAKEFQDARDTLERTGLECRYMSELNPSWAEKSNPFMCNFFWGEEFRVTYSGHITLGCCTPFSEAYSYGNLFDSTLDEVWNGPKYKANRVASREGKTTNSICHSCDKFLKDFFDDDALSARAKANNGNTHLTAGANFNAQYKEALARYESKRIALVDSNSKALIDSVSDGREAVPTP